jgi:hypothetical protein
MRDPEAVRLELAALARLDDDAGVGELDAVRRDREVVGHMAAAGARGAVTGTAAAPTANRRSGTNNPVTSGAPSNELQNATLPCARPGGPTPEVGIRVSGLGDEWFRSDLPTVDAKLFEGHTDDEIEFMGGESIINETAGLGGFAQAAAFPLQDYQGGSPEQMVANTLEMYEITAAEHPAYRIPALSFRGTPTGIDVHRVVATGIRPVMDVGVAGRGGGQIGAGLMRAPLGCFELAAEAFAARYGAEPSAVPAPAA